MELLETSGSWIIALGKTLVNSLWLGFLLLSILKMLLLMIPDRLASFRYHLSLFTMFLFTVTAGALFFQLFSPTLESVQLSAYGAGNLETGSTPVYQYICLAYLLGIWIYLGKTLIGLGRIARIRFRSEKIRGLWFTHFSKLKEKAGVKRNINFLRSDHISGPFLTGVLKPAIIVPTSMLSHLSFNEAEAILMHELYHLRRLDHWVNMIQLIIEVLFFFNPAIWMLSKTIRVEREKCCDDLVLEGQALPLDYARALYHLSLQQSKAPRLVSAASGQVKGELRNRIERILNPHTMKTNIREKTHTLMLFLGGIALLLLVSGFSSGFSISRYQNLPEEVVSEDPEMAVNYADTLTQKEKEEIKKEVEEALAEVDWDEIKEELKEAKLNALEEIDWDEIKIEIEEAKLNALEEIDWDEIKIEIEEAKLNALEEIDWDEIKIDLEEAKLNALEEIDWDEIKTEMKEFRVNLDLMLEDLDLDFDFDMDVDVEMEEESPEK